MAKFLMSKYTAKEGEQLFEASFKKKGSKSLLWVIVSCSSEKLATDLLREKALSIDSGYLLYGGPFLRK